MAPRGIFSYHNLDSTADLNARFQNLVSKGIYSGGRLSITGGSSYTVTISPYFAMTNEGMAVVNDESTSVTLNSSTLQYIVIDATYNPSGDAIIAVRSVGASDFNAFRDKYICVCSVDMSVAGGGFVDMQYVSYASRDQVTPVQDSKFLGYFGTEALRNNAYPSSIPTIQRVGDFSIIGTNASTLKFSFWSGTAWLDFVNPGSVLAALNAHIANTTMHLTQDEKNACIGTVGVPGDTNRFITNADPRVLSSNERAALTNALGGGSGGLSANNPVVAKNTVIAVPRVFQVAVPVSGNTITINAAVLGLPEFVMYLGKQGILSSGVSSAIQYFAIEDDFGNGYVSTIPGQELPVYVTDVRDGAGAVINPDSLSDSQGFYDAGSNSIRLILSANVAASARPSIRLNLRGDLSALTPNWPGSGGTSFLPAITAFRNGKQSFVSALQAEFSSITVGSRAGVSPNLQIDALTGSNTKYVRMLFNRGSTNTSSFQAIVDGIGAGSVTWNTPEFNIMYSTPGGPRGVRFDTEGAKSFSGFYVTDQSFTSNLAGITADGRIMLAHGSNTEPALYFNGDGNNTGLYYLSSYNSGSGTYSLIVNNGIGVSIAGKTALFIARNTDTSGVTDMDCPLFIIQEAQDSLMDYYIGMQNSTSGTTLPGALRFGYWNNTNAFINGLSLDFQDRTVSTSYKISALGQILGKNGSIASDEAAPSFAFNNATGTGMFYVDSWANDSGTLFTTGVGFSVNGKAALVVTKDASVLSGSITTGVVNPLIINQHIENTSELYYDFAVADMINGGFEAGGMRFGFVDYSGGYNPVMLVVNEGNNSYVQSNYDIVLPNADSKIRIFDNCLIDASGLMLVNTSQKLGNTNGNIYLGALGSSYIELGYAGKTVDVRGDVTITPVSTAMARLNFNYGSDGFIGVSTGMMLSFGSAGSDTSRISWGYGTTAMAYLSTSGHVYARREDAGISYGFVGTNNNLVPNLGIGTQAGDSLVLYGTSVIVPSNFTVSGTAQLVNASVSGTLSVGTLVLASLNTGAISATSINIPYSPSAPNNSIMTTIEYQSLMGVPGSILTASSIIAEQIASPEISDLYRRFRTHTSNLYVSFISVLHNNFSDIDQMVNAIFKYSSASTDELKDYMSLTTGAIVQLFNENTFAQRGMPFAGFNSTSSAQSMDAVTLGNGWGGTACYSDLDSYSPNTLYARLDKRVSRVNWKLKDDTSLSTWEVSLALEFNEVISGLSFDHTFELMLDLSEFSNPYPFDAINILFYNNNHTKVSRYTATSVSSGEYSLNELLAAGSGKVLFMVHVVNNASNEFGVSLTKVPAGVHWRP